jgi:hypothetical protein
MICCSCLVCGQDDSASLRVSVVLPHQLKGEVVNCLQVQQVDAGTVVGQAFQWLVVLRLSLQYQHA